MTWVVLALIVMAGLGFWNWQKAQGQLQILQSRGFDLTDDLKGEPRLVIDRSQRQIALVSPNSYRVIPMSDLINSEMLFDRGVQLDQNFRIELQLKSSEQPLPPVIFENETLARVALNKLHDAIR